MHPPQATKRVAGGPSIRQGRRSAPSRNPFAQEYEKRGACKGEKDESHESLKKWTNEEHKNRKTRLGPLERKLGQIGLLLPGGLAGSHGFVRL